MTTEKSKKIINKVSDQTKDRTLEWNCFYSNSDDLDNPYTYHQHFDIHNSYYTKTNFGKFFLITFRLNNKIHGGGHGLSEEILLSFVSEKNNVIINEYSEDVLKLRKYIEESIITVLSDKINTNGISDSADLEAYLNS